MGDFAAAKSTHEIMPTAEIDGAAAEITLSAQFSSVTLSAQGAMTSVQRRRPRTVTDANDAVTKIVESEHDSTTRASEKDSIPDTDPTTQD
jgi:hypothetical protein